MFFSSWNDLGRTALMGVLAYGAMVVLLRVSGKRTLSKMNAFDLIVTVALGSTLATIILSKDSSLAQGTVAIAVLVGMQYLLTYLSVRSAAVSQLIKSEPTLLFHRGTFLHQAMRRERVVEDEIRAAVRAQGVSDLSQIEAVVLETDGSFTVLKSKGTPVVSALTNVQRSGDA